ncbi:MAG: hypothetical protein A2Y33_10080 [Spirochaetes bacterium GWF1_51_8]|nr:MAG: hypothetical protein A2Y33_10080 [Spirochaetes bacterium GWF1_51_8]
MEKTDAIQLKGMTNVTAAIGDEFVYSGVVHGSVGFTMSYQFDGDPAIEMTGETLEYFHPEKMKAGMKGADEATLTWKFKAVAAGKVTVHFIKEYRFKEESRETIKIIVK